MADTSVMDSEREQVIRELTRHCGDGRLTLDELEERIDAAHEATTPADLQLLLRDLPAAKAGPLPPTTPRERTTPAERRAMWPPVVHHQASLPARCAKAGRKVEGPLGVAITIAGFVLLFNGFFLWAMLVWFLLPAMLKSVRRA